MCTVTYLPLQDNGFILTSNRDETILRKSALPPAKYTIHNKCVVFPKDQQANGTWIATSPRSYTLCLLNGAFEKHTPNTSYKKSRGLALLDFFHYANANDFIDKYDFKGIEPFTMLIIKGNNKIEFSPPQPSQREGAANAQAIQQKDSADGKILPFWEDLGGASPPLRGGREGLNSIVELRWDGNLLHHKKTNPKHPHIWSSVTLYSKEIIVQRKKWFKEWLNKHSIYTPDEILFFHHFAGNGNKKNNLIMNRQEKQTVSITSVINENESRSIIYEDLVNKVLKRCRIY